MKKRLLCLLCASLSLSAYGEDEKTQVLLKSEKVSGAEPWRPRRSRKSAGRPSRSKARQAVSPVLADEDARSMPGVLLWR